MRPWISKGSAFPKRPGICQYKLYLKTTEELLLLRDRAKLYKAHLDLAAYARGAETPFIKPNYVPRKE